MSQPYDVTYRGVRFHGTATWPYAVFTRYAGQGKPQLKAWHDMRYFSLPKTIRRVFDRTAELHDGGDVYALDCFAQRVIAHAVHGRVIYDAINPDHVYDDRDEG